MIKIGLGISLQTFPMGGGVSTVAPTWNTQLAITSNADLTHPVQGDTLTAGTPDVSGDPTPSVTYQWQRNAGPAWISIVGSTASVRVLSAGDVGCIVRCVGDASNVAGSADSDSNESGTVAAEPLTFPTLVGNLVALYRGDAITGVANGTPITTWPDLSGNANTLTASGVINPLWFSSLHNTRPGIQTNGTNNRVTGGFGVSAGSDYVSFHVYRYWTAWAAQRVAVDSGGAGGDLSGAVYNPTANNHRFYNSAFLGPWAATDANFVCEIVRSNGSSSFVRKNAVQVASGTISSGLGGMTIGSTQGNSQFAAVESLLHGVVKYDGSTDSSANADILAIEQYALAYADIPSDFDPPFNIVCMGNSQTAGTGLDPADRWPQKLKDALGANYIVSNLGVDSLSTNAMLGLLPAPAAGKTNICIWGEETNSIALQAEAPAQAFADAEAFCDGARTAGYDFIVGWGVLPRNAPWASAPISSANRAAVNGLNSNVTTGFVATGKCDAYYAVEALPFGANDANGNPTYFYDGTHQTASVCATMATDLAAIVLAL